MRIERVLAPNPGPFTGPGTNTYVLKAAGAAVVIDPGPVIDTHRDAILVAVDGIETLSILVTHSHSDHAPLATPLGRELGIPVLGHSVSDEFIPDELVSDHDVVAFGDEELRVVSTPGHSDDHLCFQAGDVLFTGDHIMGGSTVMVEHMGDYLRSLEKVARLRVAKLMPGHGPVIDDPSEVIDYYISHRLERERQILEAVAGGRESVGAVVEHVYADVDAELHPLAALSVAAHLRKLHDERRVAFSEPGAVWDAVVKMVVS